MFQTYFPVFDYGVRSSIEKELEMFLTSVGKPESLASLSYLLAEIIGNSDKANLKRALFQLSNLDINNPDDYNRGMAVFRDAVNARQEELVAYVRSQQAFVRVKFVVEGGAMVFAVSNSCPLHPVELERINGRLKMAKKFETIQEVMAEGLDQTEGGGFGLIICVLMLRKIGLDEKAIQFVTQPTGTTVSVVVPLNLINREKGDIIAQAVLEQVKHIPQFPEHVVQILKALQDGSKSFEHIAAIINKDPALIADVLKAANSSLYMLTKRIDSIEDAVRMMGISSLHLLVMMAMSQKLLTNVFKLSAVQREMDHAAEVAYYAYELARLVKQPEVAKSIFLCAMLHDFGKLIINAIQPGLIGKIETVCRSKGLNDFLTETLTNGYNHSIVGAELARKWNFPPNIIEAIQFHHLPLEASEPNKMYVYLTYLANCLAHYAKGELRLEELSVPVLKALKLDNLTTLETTFKNLAASFLDRKKRSA